MLKVGQEIKFSKFYPKNLINGSSIEREVEFPTGKKKRMPYVLRTVKLKEGSLEMSMRIVNSEVDTGYYIGKCKKKMTRVYSTAQEPLDTVEVPTGRRLPDGRMEVRQMLRARPRYVHNRYSTNPRRMDDPRKLDDFAIVKWGRKIVMVPMENLLKHTFNRETRVI